MATAVIDGIVTRYEVVGSGPPLLMFSPGGFDATIEKWRTQGIYARIKPLDHLSRHYACVVFDRRESGESGGRVEPIDWRHYVAQGKGLLDHLGIARAHVLGACMGCSPAVALASTHPQAVASLVLYWPVGGVHYRLSSHARFAEHLRHVHAEGLQGVVDLARAGRSPFNQEPRAGPWATVIQHDRAFADGYVRLDVERYVGIVEAMRDALFDRDTAPGAEPEQLLAVPAPALIVPGRDKTHATSAARYLEECLPRAEYWDRPVDEQTEARVAERLLTFLSAAPPVAATSVSIR